MNPIKSQAIDLVEFVYDLDVSNESWVPSLLEVALPVFDHGHGVVAATYVRPTKGGMPFPTKFYQASGPADLSERMLAGGSARTSRRPPSGSGRVWSKAAGPWSIGSTPTAGDTSWRIPILLD